MTDKPLKAFEVRYDDEGYSDITWATCNAAARRNLMGEWDCEFGQLSTKRRPDLDNFEGSIEQWKFDQGWWSSCCQYHGCSKEHISKDDGAVLVGIFWYCCQEHADLQAARRAKILQTIDEAESRVRAKYPLIKFVCSYLNAGGDVMMSVVMPSGKAVHTYDKHLLSEECELS